MSHSRPRHSCPRPLCHRDSLSHRPVTTPARTPLGRPATARCGAALRGHRTPNEVHLLAQRVAEVLVGRRTPEALRDQLAVPVREELRRLRGSVPCALAPRLTRVFHQALPGPAVEANAVIMCEDRTRVFAFRARREGGRWVCTSLETDISRRAR
ncbi:hypothetical protein DFP74_4747 [Nocardiopsis sp. Huas11]|uniref:Rv3235 family protein n=1 Tax=Nocardiopsis sp. Huas11 TaxID=2183912 RepID=UPI000EAF64F7|nr:Rv3235 family protein [Nocardiopsis sp. Huas11]RKS09019.1 hypothetical protein DFP74_4747 [Nocardiopsis sp. Huas11]